MTQTYCMYLFYFLLGALVFFGAQRAPRGEWNDGYTSLEQTKVLLGIMALGVALHHMAQKTCAPWHPSKYTVHGLDPFVQMGYLFVGAFLFCSGLGLYRSVKTKPDYLRIFVRRRILPVVIAYCLSEWLCTGVRLAMGEAMDGLTVLWYLSGLHMANFNAWYAVAICFFYLAFWAAFRWCKREGAAIFLIFLFTLAYALLGALIDQQTDWWMQGEWWYNSILLFPLGLLFGKYEARVTEFLKKGWLVWLLLAVAAAVALFYQSQWLIDHAWGYYNDWNDPMKVPHRLMSAAAQWLSAFAFVAACFLMTMKVRLGNRALRWLGGVTLEFYLVHSIFVELFGYNFHDISASLYYIKSVPLYVCAVLGCSVVGTLLFSRVWKAVVGLTRGGPSRPRPVRAMGGVKLKPRVFILIVAALAVLLLMRQLSGSGNMRVMNSLEFRLPEGYAKRYSDSRYGVWAYAGDDMRPGNLVLDGDIRDDKAGNLATAEEVLAECDWLREAELYVNPQGVRMVRGFVDYAGHPERRYYIESAGPVLLMSMIEDARYYSAEDCEAVMAQVAADVRRTD